MDMTIIKTYILLKWRSGFRGPSRAIAAVQILFI